MSLYKKQVETVLMRSLYNIIDVCVVRWMHSVSDVVQLFHHFDAPQTESNSDPIRDTRRRSGRALAFASGTCSNLQTHSGIQMEQHGIDQYCNMTNTTVSFRDSKQCSMDINAGTKTVRIQGRPDGINDKNVIVEHKRRVRGLLGYVPFHEKVQCHMYMKMCGIQTAHLVETFGRRIHIHIVPFNENTWKKIVETIEAKL